MSAVSESVEKVIGGIGQGSDSMSAVKNGVDATSDPLKAINSGLDMAKTVLGWLELMDKACPSCGYGVNIAKLGNAIREVDADIKGGKDIKLGVLIDATTSVADMIGDTSLTRGAIVPGLTIKAASTLLSYVGLVWGDTVVIPAPEDTSGTSTSGTSTSDGTEVIEPIVINTWTDLTDENGNTVFSFDEKGNFTLYNQDPVTGQRKSIDVSFSTSSSGKEASLTINDEATGTTENTLNCNIDNTGTVYNTLSDAENLLYTSTINSNTVTSIEYDTNGNIINKDIGLNNGDSTYDFQLINQSNQDLSNLFDREYEFKQLYELGGLNTSFYNYVTQEISNLIVTAPIIDVPNIYDGFDGLSLNPIGAFYESVTPANDPALSIADKTYVLLDSTNKGITASALASKDTNADGKLNGTELTGLNMWRDLNENGIADSGEITTLASQNITSLRSEDYGFHTKGNTIFSPASITAPAHVDKTLAIPTKINKVLAVPASNFRTLRDTDNTYYYSSGGYLYRINWASNQIKINSGNTSYLIGTDGNDAFDSNYYAASTQFNSSLLVNFLAGGGNDLMGGSVRNDNLWGGTGSDTLLGYAGDDKLYGEEGDDELQGQVGNDYLDGGIGNDKLFGQVGNDTLNGGDGNDALSGFTASNDTKQTLLVGETDNDYLYGGAGTDTLLGGLGDDYLDGGADNDTLNGGAGVDILYGALGNDLAFGGDGNDKVYGGDGIDELHGNAGNDYLDGGIGDDKLFGEVGDDVLVGGDGNDVMVGFTASNDTKQTLLAGETDNDTLYGGKGLDNLYGGLGNDYLDGGDDNDFVSGGSGIDTLFGGNGDDELQGGEGNDKLIGEAGNDKIFGQVGDDIIWGGEGNDILSGFTASNDTKQTLVAGESDNDTIYGGNGDDLILGGLGNDTLLGEAQNDELNGGAGNDLLYGGDGSDRLFGQVGDDLVYGGDGDDLLVGFTASNETKQTLDAGESDNDLLYGGGGYDTLLGGLGNDYLDGGAGADDMQGGAGDDTYIVNSVNDTILEHANDGYDTVISSSNYILNYGIEELRLVEGLDIHGTGNALDNKIVGNSHNNIIDGVTGADTMIGEGGDDTYYVDNAGDTIIELASEGVDTVQSTISYTLGDNVENIVLLDFSKAEKGLVDGEAILVYGYPKMNELDYMQGDAIPDYQGTCALTAIANLLTQVDQTTSEAEVVQLAIDNSWAVTNPLLPAYVRGGSNYQQQQNILDSYGMRNDLLMGYNENGIANLIKSGRGVILALNAGKLWDDAAYVDSGSVNHVVTITGAAYSESTGALTGFYIADSGRQKVSDMTRYVGIDKFREAANVPNAYAIYTVEPLKMWDEDIDATGNALDNTIIGNRGDNTLIGGAGNDTLQGGSGNDTYVFSQGDGADTLREYQGTNVNAGYDVIQFTAGVTAEDIALFQNGASLLLSYGNNDVINITDQFNTNNAIEKFTLADGNFLTSNDLNVIIQSMNSYATANDIAIETIDSVKANQDLMNIVAGAWHTL